MVQVCLLSKMFMFRAPCVAEAERLYPEVQSINSDNDQIQKHLYYLRMMYTHTPYDISNL